LIVSSNEEQTVFIKHNLLNLIYRQSIVASILIVFVSGLLSYQLKYTFGEDFGLVWYVSICTIVTAQVALYGATNIFGAEFQNRSYPIYQALLLLHALVWGGGASFYTLQLGSGSAGLIGLITLYTAIVAGIVVLAYAPLRNLAVMTATLTLLPMISALFSNRRQLDNYEGLGLLVMLGALVFTSIVMARGIQKNLKSTFELEHKQRELESARLNAEHAVELRGQFVASLSHEIRTPLNVVQGMAELLQQYPEPLDPDLSHKIDIIADSAEHLNSLVTDVLDFSRIDSNKHSVENRRFDILELSESLVSQYQIQAAQKGVQLQFVTDQLDYQFYVGPIRYIRQILINLLSNAVKYTDAGEIQISLSDQAVPGFVQIRVSDTGCGISQEDLRHIFQPYYQASEVGVETPNSTGLGLAIVNRLVTLMGGKIEVQSQPSRGTIFTTELPLELAHNQVDEEHSYLSAEQSADIGKLSILVADDSELNLELFKSFFARMGQSITQVRSGQEAVDAYMLETYQVVVLDMQMEVMGGLTACREIRALEKRLDDQPALIIVQSADNRPANEQYAIDAGADHFLAKPFKVGELSRILNRAFDTSLASEVPEPQDVINAQISEGYRETLEQVILAARAAVERGDRDALGQELHKLKGNSAMLGLTKLQRVCGEIETDVSDTSLSLAQLGDSLEILVKLVDKEVNIDTRAS
jgi:signal transduction histidine kinase/DNA-binding NarL/FixJ family response regulator